MAVERIKVNYLSAVSRTPPVGKVAVPSSHMEDLDRAIRYKIKQNKADRDASMEMADQYIVH